MLRHGLVAPLSLLRSQGNRRSWSHVSRRLKFTRIEHHTSLGLSVGAKRNFSATAGSQESWVKREAKIWAGLAAAGGLIALIYKLTYRDRLPIHVHQLLEQAKVADEEGNFTQAIKLYSQALHTVEVSPFSELSRFVLQYNLAQCVDRAGKLEEAERLYQKALKTLENTDEVEHKNTRHWKARALERLGQFAHDRKQYKDALAFYMSAVEALLGSPQVLEACMRVYEARQQGDVEASEPIISQVSPEAGKDAAGVLNNIAMLAMETSNNVEGGVGILRRCIAVARVCGPPPKTDAEFDQLVSDVEKTITDASV